MHALSLLGGEDLVFSHLHFRGDSSREGEDSQGDQRANSGLWVWRGMKDIRFDICFVFSFQASGADYKGKTNGQ